MGTPALTVVFAGCATSGSAAPAEEEQRDGGVLPLRRPRRTIRPVYPVAGTKASGDNQLRAHASDGSSERPKGQ